MDIEKEYSCLERNCKVYQKSVDIDEDYQEALPAYCDDIYRVVKCESHSYVTSVDVNYNEIKIYGKTEICITYFNDTANLCYADFEEEFTKLVDIDDVSESAFAHAIANDKYTSFRVINQRRIDIHSSSYVSISAYDKVKCPCISKCNGAKLQTKSIKTADIINSCISRCEFDEEFSAPSASMPIKRIVSSSYYVTLNESKIIKDKALVKATVNLSVLYTTDESEEQLSKCEYSFGVSKIIDASGVDENDIIICDLRLGNVFFKAKGAGNDKLSVIEAYGDLTLVSVFIREKEQQVVSDGYVLNRHAKCDYAEYLCNINGKVVNETKQLNCSLDLTDNALDVKELCIKLSSPTIRNSKIVSTASIIALCSSTDGSLCSISGSSNVEIELDSCENAIASLCIQSYDYSINSSGKIEIRLMVNVNAYTYVQKKIKVLSEINADDELIKYPTLTVYFGKQNESIWSIAKSFSSDTELITKENNLNGDFLDSNKVLIIPGV